MSLLTGKDVAGLVHLLREVYAIAEVDTFGERLISTLGKLLPCDGILFGRCDLRTMRSEFVANRPDVVNLSLDDVIASLPRDHQHPYWPYYLKTRDPRATKLSDFMSRREFHSRGFYTELYKPLRAEAEIGCMLVIAPSSHLTYVAAIRDRRDFSERDRLVLNLLQPHLSQAYENAGALTARREEVRLARTMLESSDHAVIVQSRGGELRFVTARAAAWLKEYFPWHRRGSELPALLETWLARYRASLATRGDVPELVRPLVVERDGAKLIVRMLLDEDQTILVLTEESATIAPASLTCMGVTRREAQVLAWVAEGKTNAEIAEILGLRPLTVKKHLEHIFEKLGVENRTAAAALVLTQDRRTRSSTGG